MDEPKSYRRRQAITAPDADNWTLPIGKERAALEANDTWDVVDIPDVPKDKKILDNTWIFRYKYKAGGTVKLYKARLVARGDVPDPTSVTTTNPLRLLSASTPSGYYLPYPAAASGAPASLMSRPPSSTVT
jgi:hypothetical protein